MLQDIIPRQGANAQRRMLAAAVQQANEAVIVIEAIAAAPLGGRILYVNEAFTRLTGYTVEEALGQSLQMLEAGRSHTAAHERINRAVETVEPLCVELLNYRKDGSAFWVECSIAPVFDEHDQLACWVCIQHDITRRRQAETRRRLQAALLQEAQDAIYVCDVDGHLVYWNKSAERLFGWAAAEIIDKQIHGLLFAPGDALVKEALQSTCESGKWTGELYPKSRSGGKFIVASRWTLIQGTRDRPLSILVVNTDITEKKKLEAHLLRAQRLESIGTLASGIAHDLNNVLNPILMASGLLRKQRLDEANEPLVATIEQNAQRGADILKRVLAFARGGTEERQQIHPRHFIQGIERLVRETFPRSIKIRVELEKDLWTICGNPTRLEQVLMNLSVNARDAMPDGGTLTITASNAVLEEKYAKHYLETRPGSYVVVKVSDTGVGILPDVLDKIFEPFFTTKKPGQGTGLGLSTVHRIVREMGGFIDVNSQPGQGAIFAVFLSAAEAEPALPAKSTSQALPKGRGEMILLADDEHGILRLGKAILERHGYQVLTARDGQEAVSLFGQHHGQIQVVVTDIMMPKMDGFDAIRALVEMDPGVRILATSGFVSKERLVQLTQVGAHAFLPKPFTMEQLLMALQPLLKAGPGREAGSVPRGPSSGGPQGRSKEAPGPSVGKRTPAL